jgi:hypothetical protein
MANHSVFSSVVSSWLAVSSVSLYHVGPPCVNTSSSCCLWQPHRQKKIEISKNGPSIIFIESTFKFCTTSNEHVSRHVHIDITVPKLAIGCKWTNVRQLCFLGTRSIHIGIKGNSDWIPLWTIHGTWNNEI